MPVSIVKLALIIRFNGGFNKGGYGNVIFPSWK